METDDKIKYALEHTELIRAPRQELDTFGSSVIDYYVVTELVGNLSVVRDGKVFAERPKLLLLLTWSMLKALASRQKNT